MVGVGALAQLRREISVDKHTKQSLCRNPLEPMTSGWRAQIRPESAHIGDQPQGGHLCDDPKVNMDRENLLTTSNKSPRSAEGWVQRTRAPFPTRESFAYFASLAKRCKYGGRANVSNLYQHLVLPPVIAAFFSLSC